MTVLHYHVQKLKFFIFNDSLFHLKWKESYSNLIGLTFMYQTFQLLYVCSYSQVPNKLLLLVNWNIDYWVKLVRFVNSFFFYLFKLFSLSNFFKSHFSKKKKKKKIEHSSSCYVYYYLSLLRSRQQHISRSGMAWVQCTRVLNPLGCCHVYKNYIKLDTWQNLNGSSAPVHWTQALPLSI